MTSIENGSQIGGYRSEVDQQRLGPVLTITAGIILGMRTNRWPALRSEGLASPEWENEVEHISHTTRFDSPYHRHHVGGPVSPQSGDSLSWAGCSRRFVAWSNPRAASSYRPSSGPSIERYRLKGRFDPPVSFRLGLSPPSHWVHARGRIASKRHELLFAVVTVLPSP